MKNTSGVASKVFKIFNENNIKCKLITTSEIRIYMCNKLYLLKK